MVRVRYLSCAGTLLLGSILFAQSTAGGSGSPREQGGSERANNRLASPLSSQTFKELKARAEEGDALAQDKLGEAYGNGNGTVQNGAESFRWYKKAAEQGNADASYHVGLMYYLGAGVAQDSKEAAHWFYEAADHGDADAMFHIGLLYHCGCGVEKKQTLSNRWYRRAAKQSASYPEVQGDGKDYAEALGWNCN